MEVNDSQTHKKLPFTLAGRQGTILVHCEANSDPVKAGFDHIPGLQIPLDLCLGYPIMHARIVNYDGLGYRMFCGWIQIITRESYATSDQKLPHRSFSIDLAPTMQDIGSPFSTFGFLPSIFDAPCRNLGNNVALTWIADTFLTTVPLRSRQEEIRWLAGFRWGYREYAPAEEKPVEIIPLEITDMNVWNSHLSFLRKECSSWLFKQA